MTQSLLLAAMTPTAARRPWHHRQMEHRLHVHHSVHQPMAMMMNLRTCITPIVQLILHAQVHNNPPSPQAHRSP